ncbi:MAG: transcription termination factor NusA [Ignavibacteria bacterium]|nr:transcription termination factor NusA [Ignavibacteria bacterium]
MNSELVEAFNLLSKVKNVDSTVLGNILEDVFTMMVHKEFGPDARFDVVVNTERGEIQVYVEKTVVETVTNPTSEISLEQVRLLTDEPLEVGEDYVEIVELERKIGRRAIRAGLQELVRRNKELEKDVLYNEYANSIGEIIVGEIYHQRRGDVYISHNKHELLLPRSEQISGEVYRKGASVRVLVKEVKRENGIPRVIVSRSSPDFIIKIFGMEIPEIFDGIIEIKAIAREAGERSKMAVISNDDRIDPVGACIGMKGVRIHAITRELNNESVDIITWSDDDEVFISRALSPAKVRKISLDRENRIVKVSVDESETSMAIGKGGQNIRLASKLTGFAIEIVRDDSDEYDMDLSELREELGEDVFKRLTNAGFTTAQEVLEKRNKALAKVTGLDSLKIDEMKKMIEREFENAVVEGEEDKATPISDEDVEETDESEYVAEQVNTDESEIEGELPRDESSEGQPTQH